jgi:hypothetical protein
VLPASEQPARRLAAPRLAAITPSVAATAIAAIIVFAAALFRQAGVPKIETLWAEDGVVFLQCAYDHGPLSCIGQSYQGYVHLVPRLVAAIASAVPPAAAPATFAILAALIAAGAAAIAARSIAEATSSPLAGLLGGAGLGLVWQAGREILGNAANVHWVLFGATTIAIVGSWVGSRISPWAIGMAGITGLTSAFSPLIAVFSLGSVIGRRPRAPLLFIVSTSTALVQVTVELTSHRVIPPGPGVTAGEVIDFFRDEVIRHGFFGQVPLPPDVVVPILVVVTFAGLLFVQPDRKVVVGVSLALGVLVATGVGLCVFSLILNGSLNPRYAYFPAAMIVAALAIAGGFLAAGFGRGSPPRRRWARIVMPSIIVLVGVGFAPAFRLQARASSGPDVPAEIRAAAAACAPGSVATIPISPTPASDLWAVMIPCSRLATP